MGERMRNARLGKGAEAGSAFEITLAQRNVVDFEMAAAAAGWHVSDTGERVMTDDEDEVILAVEIPATQLGGDAEPARHRPARQVVTREA